MIIHNMEQGSEEWFNVRCGVPTASMFKSLVTSKGEPSKSLPGYALTLAGDKFAGRPLDSFQGNYHTERGTELEPDARSTYEFTHDVDVEQVGFITDDDGLYGASPDGLIGSDGMSEIKCLKAENHIKAILYYKKNGRCPPDYVQQTQGQIMTAERKWCDLIFYHPDLPMLVIRQERDDSFIDKLQTQISLVLAERDKILEQLRSL
jgi:hypothetical protein